MLLSAYIGEKMSYIWDHIIEHVAKFYLSFKYVYCCLWGWIIWVGKISVKNQGQDYMVQYEVKITTQEEHK